MELRIDKLVEGGDGLGLLANGKAAFVPFTLPGETVAARLERETSGYARLRLEAVLEASARRTAAGCEYFGRCGGCQLQHADAAYQLELKAEILRETLRRIGGVDWPAQIGGHASPPWEYRNRLRLRLAARGDEPAVSYFARGSHQPVEITHCPIAAPALNDAIARLRAGPPPPPAVREIELTCDDRGAALLAELACVEIGAAPREYAAALAPGLAAAGLALAAGGRREIAAGAAALEYRVAGRPFRVSHGSFFQSNRFLVEELAALVTGAPPGERAVDLFSGVGLFALPLTEHFQSVSAVESDPGTAADLLHNARETARLHAHAMEAGEFLERWSGPLDLLVADPPRAGLGREMLAAIVRARPARLHYVSCEAPTLARDLKILLAAGYRLERIDLFDLFPQTAHIETVCQLTASDTTD